MSAVAAHPRCDACEPPSQQQQPPTSFDLAMQVLNQPMPPSVREILQAYSKSGREDCDLLVALFKAKTAEDERIAAQTELHRSLVHLQYGLPLSPSPESSPAPASASGPAAPPPSLPYPNSNPHSHSFHRPYPSPTTASPPSSSSLSNSHPYPYPRSPNNPNNNSGRINLPPLASMLGKRPRSPDSPPLSAHHIHHRHPSTSSPTRERYEQEQAAKRRQLAPAEYAYRGSAGPMAHSPRTHRLSHERTTSRDNGEL